MCAPGNNGSERTEEVGALSGSWPAEGDDSDVTAQNLHIAARYGGLEATETLLGRGAVVNINDEASKRARVDHVTADKQENAACLLIESQQQIAPPTQPLAKTSIDEVPTVGGAKKPALIDHPESKRSRPAKVSKKTFNDDIIPTYPSTKEYDDTSFAALFASIFESKSNVHVPSISAKTPSTALPTVYGGYRAFGAQAWYDYFGVDVDTEPALPSDIVSILNEEAPFMLDSEASPQRVRDNHLLTLIPSHVTLPDGHRVPFTLNQLGALVKARYFPKNVAGYRYYDLAVRTQFGAASPNKPYWLLMTRDILQGTRKKNYDKQREMVEAYSSKGYVLPSGLEAATSILACYAQSSNRNRKEHLFGKDPWTYTRCMPDQWSNREWPLVVGGFGPAGLLVHGLYAHYDVGVAGCRRFY
ncbi:MAG: hypothetical protein ACX93T_04275 [Bacteroidota bacterium]